MSIKKSPYSTVYYSVVTCNVYTVNVNKKSPYSTEIT